MTAPLTTEFGPCDVWPVRWTCDPDSTDLTVVEQAVRFATDVVWALSGRQFGLCTVTLRPCRRECFAPWWGSSWAEWSGGLSWPQPALVGGVWFNLTCGSCVGDCSCNPISEALLPAPVHDVVEVRLDGAPLVTGAYRVDDNRRLVRVDGGEWPRCNDLNLADSQVGTWSVTARYGQSVPEGGAWAVGELACQLISARTGDDCQLPRQVTQLVRQGVTLQLDNVLDLLKEGLTGLYLVDLFVRSVNPQRLARRGQTYRVDGSPGRRTNT